MPKQACITMHFDGTQNDLRLKKKSLDTYIAVLLERHQMNQIGGKFDSFYLESYACPNCKTIISQQRFNGEKSMDAPIYKPRYCQHCGQKLNWEAIKYGHTLKRNTETITAKPART